jgi:hypothetical protein
VILKVVLTLKQAARIILRLFFQRYLINEGS